MEQQTLSVAKAGLITKVHIVEIFVCARVRVRDVCARMCVGVCSCVRVCMCMRVCICERLYDVCTCVHAYVSEVCALFYTRALTHCYPFLTLILVAYTVYGYCGD